MELMTTENFQKIQLLLRKLGSVRRLMRDLLEDDVEVTSLYLTNGVPQEFMVNLDEGLGGGKHFLTPFLKGFNERVAKDLLVACRDYELSINKELTALGIQPPPEYSKGAQTSFWEPSLF